MCKTFDSDLGALFFDLIAHNRYCAAVCRDIDGGGAKFKSALALTAKFCLYVVSARWIIWSRE
jgi:hypothetical protein